MQYSNFFYEPFHRADAEDIWYIPGARRGFWILPAEQMPNQFDVQSGGCNPAHRVTDMREWSDFRTLSMMPCFFFSLSWARARAPTPTRRIPKKYFLMV